MYGYNRSFVRLLSRIESLVVLVDSAGACMDMIDLSFGLIKEDVCFAFIAFLRGA